jgi:hypothetical protein
MFFLMSQKATHAKNIKVYRFFGDNHIDSNAYPSALQYTG